MEDGSVFCGDSGYVVGVSDGGRIVPWKELPSEMRDRLRREGLLGLDEWMAVGRRVDATTQG